MDEPDDPAKHVTDLLNNHRNTLLGVQILLAGMLALPFNIRFPTLTAELEAVYLVAVLSAAVASAFLIAPAQYHRMHLDDPRATLRVGRACGTAGTVCLAVAVVAVVYLLVRFVGGRTLAFVAAGVLSATVVVLWFALPLTGRHRR